MARRGKTHSNVKHACSPQKASLINFLLSEPSVLCFRAKTCAIAVLTRIQLFRYRPSRPWNRTRHSESPPPRLSLRHRSSVHCLKPREELLLYAGMPLLQRLQDAPLRALEIGVSLCCGSGGECGADARSCLRPKRG